MERVAAQSTPPSLGVIGSRRSGDSVGSIHSASGTVDLAKRGLWQSMLLYRGLLIMLLPAIAWFLIFEYYPMYG